MILSVEDNGTGFNKKRIKNKESSGLIENSETSIYDEWDN